MRVYGTPAIRNVAFVGHGAAGKTTLVRALTGVDTDRLPEEKARGITIDLGFAHLDLADLRLGIVDVPGHERFIRNMLATFMKILRAVEMRSMLTFHRKSVR